jgi:hypothetical protein
MTAKELIVGSALLVGAPFVAAVATSSATQAQGYYYHWSGDRYRGLYNYYGSDPIGPGLVARPNRDRGGPGPRVRDGSGMGIGAER